MSAEASPPLRKGALYALLAVLGYGVLIGAMMTWHHDQQLYGAVQAELIGCKESATFNCDAVNTSAWSEIAGLPIATWAMAAYGTVAAIVWQALRGQKGAHTLLVAAGAAGSLGALFLAYQSKVELGYWCLYCLQHYAVNFAILGLSVAAGKPRFEVYGPTLGVPLTTAIGLTLASYTLEANYRASLMDGPAADLNAKVGKLDRDPEGPAPALSFTVATEDKGPDDKPLMATFQLDPDDAWKGNPHAKVAVVEFADFQCGYCKRMSSEIARLYEAYGDRVLFVFKHFPMHPQCNGAVKTAKHGDACNAAVAAVCAKDQGRFWPFHDLAFKNQHELSPEALRDYAEITGADLRAFDACLTNPAIGQQVRHDAEVGGQLHIHGTPRIFINGKLYRSGTSAEAMGRAIEAALGADAGPSRIADLRDADVAVEPIPADVPATRTVHGEDADFQIDTFEAAIVDGKAISGQHNVPALRVTWHEAKAACEAAGKRLCTEQEWVTACQGAPAKDDNGNGLYADDLIEGTSYAYGDFHEPGRCWEGKDSGAAPDGSMWRPVYTGELPGCRSQGGVYDLTGNVEEWVGDSPDRAVLLGGAFDTKDDKARCYRRNDTYGPGYASLRAGFRCCGG